MASKIAREEFEARAGMPEREVERHNTAARQVVAQGLVAQARRNGDVVGKNPFRTVGDGIAVLPAAQSSNDGTAIADAPAVDATIPIDLRQAARLLLTGKSSDDTLKAKQLLERHLAVNPNDVDAKLMLAKIIRADWHDARASVGL